MRGAENQMRNLGAGLGGSTLGGPAISATDLATIQLQTTLRIAEGSTLGHWTLLGGADGLISPCPPAAAWPPPPPPAAVASPAPRRPGGAAR